MKQFIFLLASAMLLSACTATAGSSAASSENPLSAYQGEWRDVGGNTVLIIEGDRLTIKYGSTKDEYTVQVVEKYGRTYLENPDGEHFGMISSMRVENDGALTASMMILDGDSYQYRFVRPEAMEAETAIQDLSEDLPKTIESDEIDSFSLVFDGDYAEEYGLGDLEPGIYSWNIEKQDDGTYFSQYNASGSSYIIFQSGKTVSEEYVKGLAQLMQDIRIPSFNGYYQKNNVDGPSYGLYVTYASDEKIVIRAEGDAAKTCVFDLKAIVDYAAVLLEE